MPDFRLIFKYLFSLASIGMWAIFSRIVSENLNVRTKVTGEFSMFSLRSIFHGIKRFIAGVFAPPAQEQQAQQQAA